MATYDYEHVSWLISKTFNTTEGAGIEMYLIDLIDRMKTAEATTERLNRAFTHLRAHVDDETESCEVCKSVVREYDRSEP